MGGDQIRCMASLEGVDAIALVSFLDVRALHGLVGKVDFRAEKDGEPIGQTLAMAEIDERARAYRLVEDDAYVDVRGIVRIASNLRSEEGEVTHAHAFELGSMGAQAGERGGGVDPHDVRWSEPCYDVKGVGLEYQSAETADLASGATAGHRYPSAASGCEGRPDPSSRIMSARLRVTGPHRGDAMTSRMIWKGYEARIVYDDEDGLFTGRIAGIRDSMGFHADTVEGLHAAFREAVEDYLETCAKVGKKPQRASPA